MANIKQQMLSGVFYTAIAKYSGLVISLVVMAILARLLCPDDFGTVAIATVFINFFSIFTNIGISSAIVQNKELTSLDINRIYSMDRNHTERIILFIDRLYRQLLSR